MRNDIEAARQLSLHLNSPNQVWFLGAGASFESKLPLMQSLTTKILKNITRRKTIDISTKKIVKDIIKFHKPNINIEHILNIIVDLISLANRSQTGEVSIDKTLFSKSELQIAKQTIFKLIHDTMKLGYDPNLKHRGVQKSIIDVTKHRKFVNSLFNINRAGLEDQRNAVHFVTTNYDTLIEDALALEGIPYVDGFSGGAIAFWDEFVFQQAFDTNSDSRHSATLTKLHGSIDWCYDSKSNRLMRFRQGDMYPERDSTVDDSILIYPQSTKYELMNRNPFYTLFRNFKIILSNYTQKVLFVCGYSFGDEHVNNLIRDALLENDNNLTLIVLTENQIDCLNEWSDEGANERIFVLTRRALFRGRSGPYFENVGTVENDDKDWDWWTFSGAIDLLEYGLPTEITRVIE